MDRHSLSLFRTLAPIHFTLPVAAVIVIASLGMARAEALQISDAQAFAAGKRLWHNECAGTVEGLTSWNAGEAFASLGIGHYIWYPAGQRGPFEESFPDLVRFLSAAGVSLPDWLRAAASVPVEHARRVSARPQRSALDASCARCSRARLPSRRASAPTGWKRRCPRCSRDSPATSARRCAGSFTAWPHRRTEFTRWSITSISRAKASCPPSVTRTAAGACSRFSTA